MLPDYAEHEEAIGLNWYEADPNLAFILDHLIPEEKDRSFAEDHSWTFGELVGKSLAARAEQTDKHGPVLVRYDRWGEEICKIEHHPTWLANKADLIRNGFVGLPAHAGHPVPHVLMSSLSYQVCQAETAAYCALGMTVEAAEMINRYAPDAVREEFHRRLCSLDPTEAWEGGMFLTERQGGSDVGANTTAAFPDGDEWLIRGDKHFCSNVDADLFIILARPVGAQPGPKGLATFAMPRRLPDGSSNAFHIKRLKPKLGTIGVPTAEVTLSGARAWLLAPQHAPAVESLADADGSDPARDGKGLRRMMEMVDESRYGVALMGLGIQRRSFLEASIYAARRQQFGERIDAYPLVRETLVDMLVDLEGGAAMTFECAAAADTADGIRTPESGLAEREEASLLRRILIPLAKMRATRNAINTASAALEVLGGNGYMEDWPLARQLRDAQANTVWEGTDNILCMDVLRAMRKEKAHAPLLARLERTLDASPQHPLLEDPANALFAALGSLNESLDHLAMAPQDVVNLQARRFAELLADIAEGTLLLEEASWSLDRDGDARKAVIARRFAKKKFGYTPSRGITDPDRTVIDLFEPLARYGRIEPDALSGSA